MIYYLSRWSGIDKTGVLYTGYISHIFGKQTIKKHLKERGIIPRKIKTSIYLWNPIPSYAILVWIEKLYHLMHAHISLNMALEILKYEEENRCFRHILEDIEVHIHKGFRFSESLSMHPYHFKPQYIDYMRIAEETGQLSTMLEQVWKYEKDRQNVHRRIYKALYYPAFLGLVGILCVAFFCAIVIPEFEHIFQNTHHALPQLTQYLLESVYFVKKNSLWISMLSSLLYIITIMTYRYTEKGRAAIEYIYSALPILGPLQQDYYMGHIFHILSIITCAGVPLKQGLETLLHTLTSYQYRKAISQTIHNLSEGQSVEQSFKQTQIFPYRVLTMLHVAETTGNMNTILTDIAHFYHEKIKNTIHTITALIEPISIVIIGLVIGSIVWGLYMPLFRLGEAFG